MAEFYKWYVDESLTDDRSEKNVFFVADLPHPLWDDLFGVNIIVEEGDKVAEIFFTYNFSSPKEWEQDLAEASPELIKSIWKQAQRQLRGTFDTIFNYSPSR